MNKNWIRIQDHGFKPEEILSDHYVLGGLGDDKIPNERINPSRDWRPFLPTFKDIQNQYGLETMNCTVYGTENGIEIYERKKYGIDENHDERTVGVGAETTKSGNSPHIVCEWIRHNGLTSGVLPWTPDINVWSEYYSPKPLTQEILDKAKNWLEDDNHTRIFRHQWIFQGGSLASKQQALWDILEECAPGVSVRAWQYRNGKYYKTLGQADNHWCTLIYAEWGKFWLVLDHYDNIIKTLEWNYNFGFAKRYYTEYKKKPQYETQIPIITPDGKELPPGTIVSKDELSNSLWGFIIKAVGYIGQVFKQLGNKFKGR